MADRLGIDPFTVPALGPEDFIHAAADAGFAAVSLRTIQPHTGSNPGSEKVDESNLSRVLDAIQETGIEVVAVDIIDISRDTDFSSIERGLRIASQLRSPSVSVIAKSSDRESISEGMARLCEIALPLGISPRLEPIAYLPLGTFSEAVELVSRHPGAGLMIDTLHLHRMGTDLAEVRAAAAELPVTFQINGVSPLHVLRARHAQYGATEPNVLRWEAIAARELPGRGENDVREVRTVLPDTVIPIVEAPNKQRVLDIGEHAYLHEAYGAAASALAGERSIPQP